uniref:Uncharacterized protein n=1 Tax=Arundo donax TaxID=35708 RepID=A0A0A9BD71_ARUDO
MGLYLESEEVCIILTCDLVTGVKIGLAEQHQV